MPEFGAVVKRSGTEVPAPQGRQTYAYYVFTRRMADHDHAPLALLYNAQDEK